MNYEYTDKCISAMRRELIQVFSSLKSKLAFDELNAMNDVRSAYRKADKMCRKYFLLAGRRAYSDNGGKDLQSIDEEWVDAFLEAYDPVTKYQYTSEMERKMARCFESLMAGGNKAREVETALRYVDAMAEEYAVRATDIAVADAYESIGILYVKWVTRKDNRVCAVCAERDGNVYPIDAFPTKPHWGCRCRMEIVG